MATPHRLDASLLREYDLRGIVGDTLHEADALAVGRAFGTVLRRTGAAKVCLGRDGRLSSPALAAAVARGLAETGPEVLDVGLGPTPQMYFAVHHLGADGGFQVTGSHNPPDYNGFKLMQGVAPFFGPDIQELGRLAAAGDLEEGDDSVREIDLFEPYLARLLQDYHGTRPLSVAWDAGNGAAGPVMAALASRPRPPRVPVRRGRRPLPQPPPRPDRAQEPGRPDPHREGRRL